MPSPCAPSQPIEEFPAGTPAPEHPAEGRQRDILCFLSYLIWCRMLGIARRP